MSLQSAMTNIVVYLFVLILYFPTDAAAQENMVWRSNADFVAIVPIEEGAIPNNHPLDLSVEDIYTLLGSIHITDSKKGILGVDLFSFGSGEENEDNLEVSPLLSRNELSKLSTPIAKALSEALPHEDIVFSITGRHEAIIGKSNLSTTARLFNKDNRVHIIMGDMRVSLAKKYRRRGGYSDRTPSADEMKLRNFRLKTGSRSHETALSSRLVTDKYHVLNRSEGKIRNDWMVINVREMKDDVARNMESQIEKNKFVEETGSLKVKTKNDGKEQEMLERRVEHVEGFVPVREQIEKATKGKPLDGRQSEKTVEERLIELKNLHDKNLIPEEIYQERVRALLKKL